MKKYLDGAHRYQHPSRLLTWATAAYTALARLWYRLRPLGLSDGRDRL